MGYFASGEEVKDIAGHTRTAVHNLKLLEYTKYSPRFDYLLGMAISHLQQAQALAKEQNDAANLSDQ